MYHKRIKFVACIVSILISLNVNANVNYIAKNPEKYKEEILLVFDRSEYAVNELVKFKAYNISKTEVKNVEWSNVLYVEIITCNGKAVFQSKFKFGKNGTDGIFKLPQSIITGNYYIKAYTKWMRNYSNINYFYSPITIVNPLFEQIIQKPDMYEPDFVLDTVFYNKADINVKLKDSVYALNSDVLVNVSLYKKNSINDSVELVIEGKKVKFHRAEVSHLIKKNITSGETTANLSGYSVTVVKSGTLKPYRVVPKPLKKSTDFALKFMPETRGIAVSGKLKSTAGNAIVGATVHISVFNGYTETQSVLTDTLGNFVFAIPELFGEKEILVIAQVDEEHEVLIDNDYCGKPVYLPFIPFDLTVEKYEFYNTLVKNGQVAYQYANTENITVSDSIVEDVIYYNTPNQKVNFAEFVEMPSIEDYIRELLTLVVINKQNNKSSFKVFGAFSELSMYPPLVMIDHVVVTNIDALLAVDPNEIETVEVLAYPYIKGNNTYGGVVNFFSKNNDMGKMELPKSGLFFDYAFYNNTQDFKKPTSTVLLSNSLYWDAHLKLSESKTSLQFKTGLNTGSYSLRFNGVDSMGNYFVKEQKILIE